MYFINQHVIIFQINEKTDASESDMFGSNLNLVIPKTAFFIYNLYQNISYLH